MNINKILLVKGQAGLGNRILCLLTAILYARLTNRALIIDWSDSYYSNNGTNSFEHFFDCKGSFPTADLPETDSIVPVIWRDKLDNSVSEMLRGYANGSIRNSDTWAKLSVDLSRLDHEDDILVMWSHFEQIDELRRHFHEGFAEYRGKSTRTILRNLLRQYLSLNPAIQKHVNDFKKAWKNTKTIGLHIRYSDKKSRLMPMLKKLDSLVKKNPDMQIFLATDNSEIKDRIESNYTRVLTTPKFYPKPGSPMHFSFDGSDQIKHGIEALIDMYLLASCDYLILDESSAFAYISTIISKTPRKRIYNYQLARWVPASARHKIWIFKGRLERKLFPGKWQ